MGENMLKIVVCDDDNFTLKIISELLEDAIQESNINAKIVCLASTGNELLNFIQNNADSYLYFLDFDFGQTELNGIDLVRIIYRIDPKGKVVFVTSHTDKAVDILKSGIQAFGYIEKSLNQRKMINEYCNYIKMAKSSDSNYNDKHYIELSIGINESVQIPVSEITYVDSVKTVAHCICYHTFDRSEITVRDTIEHSLELLGKNFIRCHRSIIVNKNYVISLKKGLLKLSNGTTVLCALSKQKFIKAECFNKM